MVFLRQAYRVLFQYHAYDELIAQAAGRHAIDPSLVWTVIWRESRFDPYQVGRAGEIGLMQVTRNTGLEWASVSGIPNFQSADLFNAQTNIAAGTWYLARALRRWAHKDQPLLYALAEYNAGRANARRWAALQESRGDTPFSDCITYPSTRRYVMDILRRYRSLR